MGLSFFSPLGHLKALHEGKGKRAHSTHVDAEGKEKIKLSIDSGITNLGFFPWENLQ